jgi:hypothetical protein
VDGEVGRFEFEAYRVKGAEGVDSARIFPILTGQEWYRTAGFKELGYGHGSIDGSYRHTAGWLNRLRHQAEAGTPSRTLHHNSEQAGQALVAHLDQVAGQVLAAHQFEGHHPPVEQRAAYQNRKFHTQATQQVVEAVEACVPDRGAEREMLSNPVPYEVRAESVLISIDPVGVKKQKETRQDSVSQGKREMVYQTVAHLQHGEHVYTLNGSCIGLVLKLILAFLLHNDLLKYNLIFFVDGQRSLHNAILALFAWFGPLQLVLDWVHLQDKCRTLLSVALKGRDIRNQVLEQLLPLLWLGLVEQAIALLQTLDPTQVKDQAHLDKLIGYFRRQRPYIPCYAVRKRLNLRNSSNLGEKANDLLVSSRQKHNGMSWSSSGSVALAALTALVRNNEHHLWFRHQSLRFSFPT